MACSGLTSESKIPKHGVCFGPFPVRVRGSLLPIYANQPLLRYLFLASRMRIWYPIMSGICLGCILAMTETYTAKAWSYFDMTVIDQCFNLVPFVSSTLNVLAQDLPFPQMLQAVSYSPALVETINHAGVKRWGHWISCRTRGTPVVSQHMLLFQTTHAFQTDSWFCWNSINYSQLL